MSQIRSFFFPRLLVGVVLATLSSVLLSGCGGGWGALKPTVTAALTNQTVNAGQTATFTVGVTGTGPIAYQWYRNAAPVPGVTGPTLSEVAQAADNGAVFSVAASNAGGTATSEGTLTVNVPPTISTQPASQSVTAGQAATFTASATGTAPLTYQWYKSGAAISGASASTYTTAALTLADNGSVYSITVTNMAGSATSAKAALTVKGMTPTLSFSPVGNPTFGAQPIQLSATSASGGAVTYTVVSGSATISGNMLTLTGAGTVVIAATQAASGDYGTATANISFTVAPQTPTLTFAPIGTQTYGAAAFPVSASSASTGAVTFSVVSGPATISGSTVTVTGSGTVVLGASQAATANYTAASAQTTFTVGAEKPTLSFAPIASQTYGNQPFQVSATSSSPGAVTYSVLSGPATIAGNVVTLTGTGSVTLAASQAASGSYAASTAQTTFTVGTETPTLSFAPVAPQTYGNQPFPVSATSASQGPVTYSVVSGPATIAGSTVTLTGSGTVVLSASQAASGNYAAATANVSIPVSAEKPFLAFAPIPAQTYGGQPFSVTATSASPATVIYTVVSGPATVVGNLVTITGSGTVVLAANQAASGSYAAATATTSFDVASAAATLAFAPISSQTYGTQPFQVSATSPSTAGITYSVLSGRATISGSTVTLTGTGTVVLGASQAASGSYKAATAQISFAVLPGSPTLTFSPVPNQTFSNQPVPVNATSASDGAVTYTVTGPATISGNVISLTGAGTVQVNATQAATSNYNAANASTTFTVTAATPTLAFATVAPQTFSGQSLQVSATSASNGAVSYSVVSGPATVAGSTVTLTGAGTVVLGASQAATSSYSAATANTSFSVAAGTPTLTFTSIADQAYGTQAIPVSATSASNGAVTYTVTGPATVSGSTISLNGTGTVVVTASQAATTNYNAASATTSFAVTAATPTLTFTTIPAQTYGSQTIPVSATSASNGAVTYTVTGPATISGSTISLTGAGTVVVTANQAATANYTAATATTNFTVAAATPTLTFATVANQTYGSQTIPVSATSASNGAVTYTATGPATISGSTISLTGAGTVVVTANQAATANYTAASTTTSFTVAPATPTLSFTTIPSQTYGSQTIPVSATSASNGAVTYTVTGPATISGSTISLTGAGTVVVTANQAATVNYTAATATTNFTVGAATPTLAFTTIPSQTYGSQTIPVSATSASNGTVSYTVTGPATISGSTISLTGIGTVVVNASQAATANYAAATATTSFAVAPANPNLVFNNVPVETYGNQPFQVSATSASSGAVTYSVVSGPATISGSTVTPSGTGTVVLGASQLASGNYAAGTATVNVLVASNVTITAISPANATIAPQQQTFTATATGGATNNLQWTATAGSFSGNVWTAPTTAGTYTITATSVDEPSISRTTTITVAKPLITLQPVSKNACSGYNPSLSAAASYATSYQWYLNGNALGITTPTITFPNVTNASNGSYTCAAINAAGSVSTNTVTLNVVNPTTLAITSQPSSVTVYATQTATFSVGVSGTGNLTYQWYTGTPGSGTPITGATSGTYTTGALTASSNGTKYYVTVSDPDCTGTTLTSSAATLTVSTADSAVPPTIVVQPVGQTATVGGTATFSVTASGSGTLTYQWYRVPYSSTAVSNPQPGSMISGATSSTYTVPSSLTAQSNDGDNYYVVVNNAYGTAVSNRVVLATGAGIVMQVTQQPQAQYISANTLASFSVGASCTGCTAAYKWYWYAPGTSTAALLSNGAISSGVLSGAKITGATTSSLTLQNVPTTASGGVFYAVVTSTSDGTSQIAGTNPLSSNTAGLFVGSLGTIGNTTAGKGLCNSGTANWVLNGTNPGTSTNNVPYQDTTGCDIQLTNGGTSEAAAVYWPSLISTAKFSVSFTVAMTASGTPADGFAMVLADPSQGATTHSIGTLGEGIGANGIPGFVLAFDTYQNGQGQPGSGCNWSGTIPCDPVAVPYMAVGQGSTALWENPWTFVNGALDTQNSTNYTPFQFANSTHTYVVTVVNHIMTVTMDGYELFTGTVTLPSAGYLGFTASTGGSVETVTFSNLTATISAP